MENFQNFQILITTITQIDNQMGQFMLEMKNLKTLVEGACENKHIMKEIMKLLDYMKEQHCIQISKNQKYFDEQTSKYKYKIEELKAYASSKDKEVETLEERVTHQENHINYCEDYITRVNEFITDKVFNIFAVNIVVE
jgi:phenylalanyl-tRNA synthetase alpha subunit